MSVRHGLSLATDDGEKRSSGEPAQWDSQVPAEESRGHSRGDDEPSREASIHGWRKGIQIMFLQDSFCV